MTMRICSLILCALTLQARADYLVADGLTPAKITELAVHRIERLVTLKKIDSAFETALIALRAEATTENGAAYKVFGNLAPGADGKSMTITLWQDPQGKNLSFGVTETSKPASPFVWPEKDAVTLIEEALHFVLEGWAQHPEVTPYFSSFQTISLSPQKNDQGQWLAHFETTCADDRRILMLDLKTDGTYISHQLK